MTDTSGAQPYDDSVPPVPAAPPVPPAVAGNGASYDAAPYTPPPAPQYDTGGYAQASEPPAYAPPAYAPPTYPTSPYATAPTSPYGAAPAAAPAPYGGQYGAPAAAPYGYGAYAPPRRTNGLAVASMVLSILGFLWILPLVGPIAGAIMGHLSLGQIKRSGEAGRGMALAGVIVGWAGLGLLVLVVLFFVFVIAVGTSSTTYRYGA